MTVIKGQKGRTLPSGRSSTNNSDVESLHLGQESRSESSESLNRAENVPEENSAFQRPFAPLLSSAANRIEELLVLKRHAGKRRRRRFQNGNMLHTLVEVDEDDSSFFMVMDSYKGPLSRLLEDEDALDFWDEFIQKSEDEQARIVDDFSNKVRKSDEEPKKELAFRFSKMLKRNIKVKKFDLEAVKHSEDDLIEFFEATPQEIYTQFPPSYIERLLLHAMAKYHRLQSLSLIENGTRKIDVFNPLKGDWKRAECFLTDFVAQLRA